MKKLGLHWESCKNSAHLKEKQNNIKIPDLIQLFSFSPVMIIFCWEHQKKKSAFSSQQPSTSNNPLILSLQSFTEHSVPTLTEINFIPIFTRLKIGVLS